MIEQDEGLQNLLLDEEVSVTLRRRDWITLAVLWTANAGEAEYTKSLSEIGILEIDEPRFKPCMRSPRHLSYHDCYQERILISKELYPFITLKSDD